jgi:arylsulfatase A-like enzyme
LGFTDLCDTEGKMNAGMRRNTHEADLYKYGTDEKIPDDALAGPYQRYLKARGRLGDFSRDYNERLYHKPVWYSAPSVLSSEDTHDAFIGRKACEYLENVSDEFPWHLFVSFAGPHDPWDAPAEHFERYREKLFPDPIAAAVESDKPGWIRRKSESNTKGMGSDDLQNVKRHYAGMINLIDGWTGKLLDILEKKKLAENTVIIFCSDHGEMLGDHGQFTKNNMYEGSLRVPLLISHPEIKSGRVDDSLAQMVDLFPTILNTAGIEYLKDELDGQSLLPVILGREKLNRSFQFSELRHTQMIYDGQYKFIINQNDINELYNLENDPLELHNIAQESPEKVRELIRQMRMMSK